MMRVFVAGATGAIGKQLVPRLVKAGHEVHGIRLPGISLRPVEVNGGPGALFLDEQQLLGVWALDIAAGQITSISSIVNPDKLAHLGPVADIRLLLRPASRKTSPVTQD